jgi:nicotinate-nucleotide--dimethylbenzimidazole phosphoribosyltransferase
MTLAPTGAEAQSEIAPDPQLAVRIQREIDHKTKPLGALGRIEVLAAQIAALQGTVAPRLETCTLTIFAADHGIAAEGVSAFPPEVTRQMVANFLAGGAAASVFARTLNVGLKVVDAGVAGAVPDLPGLIRCPVGPGTANSACGPAMTDDQLALALETGARIARETTADALAFGEMGIANTSAASLVAHKVTGLPLARLIGRGTGLDPERMAHKYAVLARAAARTPEVLEAHHALTEYGGFEIAMMVGAMTAAAADRRLVLVDGFIATAAAAVVLARSPGLRPALVFCHRSAEAGHDALLGHLAAAPVLDLQMRLGEGTGALLAWPILRSAARMLTDMASFAEAGVTDRA